MSVNVHRFPFMRRVGFLVGCGTCLVASLAGAQSATITVAPIPATVAGNTVVVSWTVTNTGGSPCGFGVGAEIRLDESMSADLGGETTPTLAPGASTSGSFAYLVPTWWSGDYIARAAVWTGPAGSSTWLGGTDRHVTVDPIALTLSGRVVYHATSEYLALPVDADDGHIFLRVLPRGPLRKLTEGLPVENAVNPHLSPDGSRVAFTAIPRGVVPAGTPRDYASLAPYLEIYALDLARVSLARLTNNHVPDEDGSFSPDGREIVFKRAGEIWTMSADGTGAARLASGGGASGPSYSQDGSHIVYWEGAGEQADIWSMSSSGSGATRLVGSAGLQEYYPTYRDAQTLLFSRWESVSDRHDKLYACSLGSGATERLPVNLAGVDDADAFPVAGELIGFSSTRRGGRFDLYFGDTSTGAVVPVGPPNQALQELAGCYSPYLHARALSLLSPTAGSQLATGSTAVMMVRAYSDGGVWAGAAPRVLLQGPTEVEYSGFRDDGVGADDAAGDGIYSSAVELPSPPGTYQVVASTTSSDDGFAQELRSTVVSVTLGAPTAIAKTSEPLTPFELRPIHPNPLRSLARIEFAISHPGFTSLGIYDPSGVRVESLVERELPVGRYRVPWDASRLPSGAYFYRLQVGELTATRKVVLIK